MTYSPTYIALFQGTCRELEKLGSLPFWGQSQGIKSKIGDLAKQYGVDANADQILGGRGFFKTVRSKFLEDNPEQVLNQYMSQQAKAKAAPSKEKPFASIPTLATGTALGVGGTLGGDKLYDKYQESQARSQDQALQALSPQEMDLLTQYYQGGQYP